MKRDFGIPLVGFVVSVIVIVVLGFASS